MTLPGWVPRWFLRLSDLLVGSETTPGFRCLDCGQEFYFEETLESEAEANRHAEVHSKVHHPERWL